MDRIPALLLALTLAVPSVAASDSGELLCDPLPPEIVCQGLEHPDGAALVAGDLQNEDWATYAGSPERTFWNARESTITAANVAGLAVKWTFPTGAIVTASPSIARIALPDEGRIPVAFIQSWDANVYALRVRDGSEVWRFATEVRDGVTYPNTASVHIGEVDGQPRIFVGSGQTFYALDAVTGEEVWHFDAGTGCIVPGACSYTGERNEIESSALLVDDKVVFGMDVENRVGGKGGFYALDARDGRLRWFFDLESGMTCTPGPTDDIRRYDGYHSEAELGLPAGFLTTRSGCDHPRTPNGCENVWSSPAYDGQRGFLYFASANCDTDTNPLTLKPAPPMPPYDGALVALDLDGHPVWRWRPREVDDSDFDFGAAPNLFTAAIGGAEREVVGIGNKDGTYYVFDRDGVNEVSGVAWDDADPSALPYWRTNVVPGGDAGGIIATAAVDDAADRIYFGTAPGNDSDVFTPQRPTMHALDAGTGTILWENTAEVNAGATFAPTSGFPGVVFTGTVLGGYLRGYDTTDGTRLTGLPVGVALASAPAFWDGVGLVGAGIGTRDGDPSSLAEKSSRVPQPITAVCVPGTPPCAVDRPVSGRRLRLSDHPDQPERRRLRVSSNDPSIVTPEAGGPADPSVAGASLRIVHPFRGEEMVLPLPAAGWFARGKPAGSKGYRYRDSGGAYGPCRRAEIRNGRLDVRCRGTGLTFTLDEPNQQALVAAVSLGTESVLCMRFGGDVKRDIGSGDRSMGAFSARDAPAPPACPLP